MKDQAGGVKREQKTKKGRRARQAIVIYPKSTDGVGAPVAEPAAKEKQNGESAATGMRACRSLHLIPTSPQDPGPGLLNLKQNALAALAPAGQDHGRKNSLQTGGGEGLANRVQLPVCKRLIAFLLSFPLGPTGLASCTRGARG